MNVTKILINNISCSDISGFSCKVCKDFILKRRFIIFKTSFFNSKYDFWNCKDNDLMTVYISGEDCKNFIFEKDRFWLKDDDYEELPIKQVFLNFYPNAKDIIIDVENNFLVAVINDELSSFEFIQINNNFLFKERIEIIKERDNEININSNDESFSCLKENCPYNENTKCCYFRRISDHYDIKPACQNPFEYMEIARENPHLAEFL